MTEDEMVGWHHQLNGCTFEQTLGDGEGQRSLVCLQSMVSQRIGHNLATEQQQMQCLPPSLEYFYHFKKNKESLNPFRSHSSFPHLIPVLDNPQLICLF